MKYLILILMVFTSFNVFSHGGEDHNSDEPESKEQQSREISTAILKEINAEYIRDIKPVFKNKCLDCHGTVSKKPWYYVMPGVRQLIDHDIEEAKEHMDMTNDFPFGGHGSPEEDLSELKKTIEDGEMPPIQYKLMHWSSSITDQEKNIINKWINKSLITIKKGE
tara:strand:- start:5127 stop:5621 length:495 start_codon:yes stop_codon:yes gene_type:complete